MQKHKHRFFLLVIKKKYEHDIKVVFARSKKKLGFEKLVSGWLRGVFGHLEKFFDSMSGNFKYFELFFRVDFMISVYFFIKNLLSGFS